MKTMRSITIVLLVSCLAVGTFAQDATIVSNTVPLVEEAPVRLPPAEPEPVLTAPEDTKSLSRSNAVSRDLGIGATRSVRPGIRLLDDGAVADYGLFTVRFPAELTEAPITILTPNGRKLACRATFLALFDAASGQSLLLGEVQKTIGELDGDSTVLYPNAFDTVAASIRFRYTPYSLEQDILLLEQIQLPKEFQPENVQLEVWSAWIDSTPDAVEQQIIDLRPKAATSQAAGRPANDDVVTLGGMRIADGYAFGIQGEGAKTPVAKTFARIEGHDWLIERVDYTALKPMLDLLPKPQASLSPDKLQTDREKLVRSLHARSRSTPSGQPNRTIRMAQARTPDKASVVVDFIIVSSVPAPSGLLAWWTGGGNPLDSVGNANATMLNGAGYGSGKVGQAFNLDGSNDRINATNSAALNFGAGADFSIEAWIKPLTNNTTYGVTSIVDKRNAPNASQGLGYEISLVNGKVACRLSDSLANVGTGYGPAGPDLRMDGNFHHVAMTVDRDSTTGGKLYVDGAVVLTFDPTAEPGNLSNTEPVRIGNHATASLNCYFKGIIDEPSIYNRALSASEVLGIYNAGAAGKNNPKCITPPADIAGWWPGDGNAYDLARTNFGTLVGNTAYVPAVAGQGFSFDGTGDGVTIPNNAGLNVGVSESFSLEAWIQPLTNSTTYGVTSIVDKRVAPNTSQCLGYVFCLVNGVMNLRISDSISGNGANFADTQDLRIGSGYHHIAVTVNRGSTNGGHFYVDGVQRPVVFNPTVVSGSLSNAGAFLIGLHAQTGFNGGHKGVIDEVTFYRRELTNTEIAALYSAGGAGKCKVDTDGDGLTDLQEAFLGTNPNDPDSDHDGLTDGDEVFVYHTKPNSADEDGDGMSDGWELFYFGSLAQTGTGDYDSDGVSNLQEYLNGSDPNNIVFVAEFDNDRVSSTTPFGAIQVVSGVPSRMAILVNTTDFASANWVAYSSTINLNLGPTDGKYEVWIGLKGMAQESQATWDMTPLVLDRAAPAVIITSPSPGGTLAQPMIQLRGYSPEPLTSLRFDVTNAAGLQSDLQAIVLDQYYDTNQHTFTTNTFQCFDVDLTNGLNTITLRAVDLAGNISTNLASFTLDLSGDVTPPLVSIYWPQDGTSVSDTSLTVRGIVDDPTATVIAQVTNTSGTTNIIAGLVERYGLLWIEGLPLEAGTNIVTLTATDAAGNVVTTNIAVIRSAVALTIDAVPAEQFHQLTVQVTGTIDTTGYAVWVNGVRATDNGDGSWTAIDVPLNEGCTAVIQARAIPISDNGGNGTGGSGGGLATDANLGNPNSASGVDREGKTPKPARIYIKKHHEKWSIEWHEHLDFFENINGVPGAKIDWVDMDWKEKGGHYWEDGVGGNGWWSRYQVDLSPDWNGTNDCKATINWPPSKWPELKTGTWVVNGECIGPRTPENPPCMPMEHCDVKNPPVDIEYRLSIILNTDDPHYGHFVSGSFHMESFRFADATVNVFTGDKSVAHPKRQSILELASPVIAVTGDASKSVECGIEGNSSVRQATISVGQLGRVNDDYTVYAALPHGETVDATVHAPPKRFNWAETGDMHDLAVQPVCNITAGADRTTVGVGELANLSFVPSLAFHYPLWGHTGGGLNTDQNTPANSTLYTASSNTTSDRVMANFPKGGGGYVTLTSTFTVRAPTGINATLRGNPDFYSSPYPKVGAGMKMDVVLQPTTVSFNRVQIVEPAEATTGITGYFSNHTPPTHAGNGAGVWHAVDCGNKVLGPPIDLFDHAYSGGWPIGTGGTYTWPIHPRWKVEGTSTDYPLSGWTDQVHTLSADGTMRVDKLGHHVTRGASESNGTAQ